MKTLYIIGNGFDLYHGLDTTYQSFAKYLKDSDSEVFDLMLNYYYLPDITQLSTSDNEYAEWARFEDALADLDYQQVLDDNSGLRAYPGSPDFKDGDWGTYQIEMEMIVDKLTDRLTAIFNSFILNVKYPESVNEIELKVIEEGLFLNFNFTNTLERYYGINNKNICYIHEKANEDENTIILGHGIDPETLKPKLVEPPKGLSDEDMEQWSEYMSEQYDFSYETAKDEILSYYSQSFKNTQKILKDNSSFFKRINPISNVIVLGHSISPVDLEYFKFIKNQIKSDSKWVVSYYSELEKETQFKTLESLGIIKNNLCQIRIEELK